MTTLSDSINETKSYLYASHREVINILTNPINTTDTTLTFVDDLGQIAAGAILCIDLELMYVRSISSNMALVIRGYRGSTVDNHAANAQVSVNPIFNAFDIVKAINNTIYDISGQGIFKAVTTELTFIGSVYGYDLTGAVGQDITIALDAKYDLPGSARDWPDMDLWEIYSNANPTDFPSTYQFRTWFEASPGRAMRVSYGTGLSPLVTVADDVLAVSGVQTPAHDLLAVGAALRLQGTREGQRNFNEVSPASRRATDVPAGAQINGARMLADTYQSRLRSEKLRQLRQWPFKRKVL